MLDSRVISIVNQKGGVGKTTTSVNLSTALAAIKKNILLIDLDPQGNLSTGLGIKYEDRENSVYDLIMREDTLIEETSITTKIPGLDIIPSSFNLSGIEFELANENDRNKRLLKKLAQLEKKYDFVIIDCPPSLGILTVNSLVASRSIIVPLQCEFYALEGLAQLLRSVELVKKNLNPNLTVQGIVLTMFDSRNNLSEMVVSDVKEHFGKQVYKTIIPRNVRISEAPSFGQPVLMYDINCAGSRAYTSLAAELLKQENVAL